MDCHTAALLMKLFIHALVSKSFFICFLSANNGLEHLCSQPDRFHVMSLEVRRLAQSCCSEGAMWPVWVGYSIRELRGLWQVGAPWWPEGRWVGRRGVKADGRGRRYWSAHSFGRLCPECLGQHMQKGKRKLTGHEINLFTSQTSVILN